jgi:Family of unknown function (DUF6331)
LRVQFPGCQHTVGQPEYGAFCHHTLRRHLKMPNFTLTLCTIVVTHESDIEIRPKEFIKWVQFDPTKTESIEVDSLFIPLDEFLSYLDTYCESLCCGISAFDWKEENVKIAYSKIDKEQIVLALNSIIAELEIRTEPIVSVGIINQLIERKVLIELLQHLKNSA